MKFFSLTCFKKILNSFFDLENMKKTRPQKLLIIGPQLVLRTNPTAQTAQKQKSRTTKCPLMQDWIFRLGAGYNGGRTAF